jgi:hypothetical protein
MAQQRAMVEVVIAGRTIPGPWSFKSGGQASAEASRRFPGHMLPAETDVGPASRENIILRRKDDLSKEDMERLEADLGADSTVVFIRLDQRKQPWRRRAHPGKFLRVQEADYDASSTETSEMEFEFTADGP